MKWLWSDLNWYHLARAPILKSQSKSDKSDHGIPRIYSPRVHQMIHVTFANSNWPPLTYGTFVSYPTHKKLHDSSSDLKVHLLQRFGLSLESSTKKQENDIHPQSWTSLSLHTFDANTKGWGTQPKKWQITLKLFKNQPIWSFTEHPLSHVSLWLTSLVPKPKEFSNNFFEHRRTWKKRQWYHVTYAQKNPDVHMFTFMEEGSVWSRVWGPFRLSILFTKKDKPQKDHYNLTMSYQICPCCFWLFFWRILIFFYPKVHP